MVTLAPNTMQWWGPQDTASSGGGGGGSCPVDGSPSLTSDQTNETMGVARADASFYAGQNQWNDGGTPRTICKLGFKVTALEGDLSGLTYVSYIFANTVNNFNPASPVATSTGRLGTSLIVGWNYWSFPTPFLTTASQNYALVITPNSHHLSNNIWLAGRDTDNIAGYPEIFDSAGVINFGPTHPASLTGDIGIKIFWLT